MKPKILVVDDQESILELLKAILERENFEVFLAANGFDALDIIAHNEIDLVITDVSMPELDGFTLLQIIKNRYPNLPVIVMTGYYDIYTKEEAIKYGASRFLPKPFRPEEVLKIISNELGVPQ
ncbi:MAG: response regulator [bacterium]